MNQFRITLSAKELQKEFYNSFFNKRELTILKKDFLISCADGFMGKDSESQFCKICDLGFMIFWLHQSKMNVIGNLSPKLILNTESQLSKYYGSAQLSSFSSLSRELKSLATGRVVGR